MAGINVTEKRTTRIQVGTSPEKVVAVIGITEKGSKDDPISVFSYDDAVSKLGAEIKNNDTMAVIKSVFDEYEALGLDSPEVIVVNPAYTKGLTTLTDKKSNGAFFLPSMLSSEAGKGLLKPVDLKVDADFTIDSAIAGDLTGDTFIVSVNGIQLASYTALITDDSDAVASELGTQITAILEFATTVTGGNIVLSPLSGVTYNGNIEVTGTGAVTIASAPMASPIASGEKYTTTKARMLNLSNNDNYVDPVEHHVSGSKGNNLSYSSIQVMIEDTVIGVCDENYKIVPVYDYVDPSEDTYRVIDGMVSMPVDIDEMFVDEIVAQIRLNRAYTGTGLKLVYTLNNSDDFKMKQNVNVVQAPASSLLFPPELVPSLLPITSFDSNSLLLKIDGTNYIYDGKLPAFDANPVAVDVKEAGGISVLSVTVEYNLTGLSFTVADIEEAHIDIDFSTQAEYLEDPSIYLNQSINNLLQISARHDGEYYNRLSLFLDRKESSEDDNGNTNTVDSHLIERLKGSIGFDEAVSTGEVVSNLDFEDTDYNIVKVLSDDEMGFTDVDMEDNGDSSTMPLALQNITSVSGEKRYFRKESNDNTANGEYSIGVDGYTVIPASTYIEKYDASGTIVVATYRDNGVGGFYNEADSAVSGITLDNDGLITIPAGELGGGDSDIRIHFALRRPDQSVFASLSNGRGGTEDQVLRSDILFGEDISIAERGVYALLKDSRMMTIVIPDLAYSYEVYQEVAKFMAEQPVARFSYVWSLSDEIKPSEVSRYTRYNYKQRDKNTVVCYPSFVTRTTTGLKRTIPYVGVIAAKITYMMIKNEPQTSIAGTDKGAITHGVGPSQKISIKMAENFDELVVPVISTDDTGHAVWGDSSFGNAIEGFESIQDTLAFNMTQFEAQKLLWSSVFKEAGLTTLSSVRRKIGSFLLNNYKDGWYGEADSPSDAYVYDDSTNTLATIRSTRTIDIDIEIATPVSLKWVNMGIGRKF